MTVLLDTNVCIAVINGDPPSFREYFKRASRSEQPLISSISVLELWFGVANSSRADANTEQLTDFFETVQTLPFDEEDAHAAGYLRAELKRAGSPLSAYDLLIAAQAIRRKLSLVTADRDFAQVRHLRTEQWGS